VGDEIFRTCQTGSEAHPGSFTGVKWPGRGADHPPPSSPAVRDKSIAIPLLPLWVFVVCYRVNFTFTFDMLEYFSKICPENSSFIKM